VIDHIDRRHALVLAPYRKRAASHLRCGEPAPAVHKVPEMSVSVTQAAGASDQRYGPRGYPGLVERGLGWGSVLRAWTVDRLPAEVSLRP